MGPSLKPPSRLERLAQAILGGIAKGTMVLGAMVGVVLMVLSGDLGGAGALKSRNTWMNALLAMVVVVLALGLACVFSHISSR